MAVRKPETQLGYSLPLPRWREIERLSNTRAYELLASGEVDSIVIGSRRFIIVASWREYLEATTARRRTRRRSEGRGSPPLCGNRRALAPKIRPQAGTWPENWPAR